MKLFIVFGLLFCCVCAEDASTTEKQDTSSSSADTTTEETTVNTTAVTSPVESSRSLQAGREGQIERLLKANTVALSASVNLISQIEKDISRFSVSLHNQLELLPRIGLMEQQFLNSNYLIKDLSDLFLQALANTTYKVDINTKVTLQTIENLARGQQEAKDQVIQFQSKLTAYQSKVLNSSQSIDKNLLQLTEIISRAIMPKLKGLKTSFGSFNTSQSNIQDELKIVDSSKKLTESSIHKLNALDLQLAYLNHSQDTQLGKLSEAVKYLAPENLTVFVDSLQDLIVSQKRIELNLAICDNKFSTSSHGLPKSKTCGIRNPFIEISTTKSNTSLRAIKNTAINPVKPMKKTDIYDPSVASYSIPDSIDYSDNDNTISKPGAVEHHHHEDLQPEELYKSLDYSDNNDEQSFNKAIESYEIEELKENIYNIENSELINAENQPINSQHTPHSSAYSHNGYSSSYSEIPKTTKSAWSEVPPYI